MKRKILTTVSLLLTFLFAFGGYGKAILSQDTMKANYIHAAAMRRHDNSTNNSVFRNAAASTAYSKDPIAKEEAPSSACFVTNKIALIIPDGKDPSILIRNIIADMVDDYVSPESIAAFEAGIEYTDPRDIMVNAITEITGPYYERHMSADFRYPDWYGGSYIMRKQEYGVDAPYETDGTDEPFKYCLQVTRGMESQIEDLKELLKPYEDYIIYKTVEFSVNQRMDFLDSVMKPAFDELGVKCPGRGADFLTNAVDYEVYEEYFNEDIFALAKKLANDYGYTIIIIRSGPGIAE